MSDTKRALVNIIDDYLESPASDDTTIRQQAEMLVDRLLARMREADDAVFWAMRIAGADNPRAVLAAAMRQIANGGK